MLPVSQGPIYSGPAYKATQAKFTAKLLNNPHTALRRNGHRNLERMDGKGVRHAAGEQWWGPTGVRDPRLQAQKPLLDGGEGKSLNKAIVNNVADVMNRLPEERISDLRVDPQAGQTWDPTGVVEDNPQKTRDPPCESQAEFAGLMPPTLDSTGGHVTGADKAKH